MVPDGGREAPWHVVVPPSSMQDAAPAGERDPFYYSDDDVVADDAMADDAMASGAVASGGMAGGRGHHHLDGGAEGPPKEWRCYGAKRWAALCACGRNVQLQREVVRTLPALLALLATSMTMTMCQIVSDRWFALNIVEATRQSSLGEGERYATDPLYDRVLEALYDGKALKDHLPDALLLSFVALSAVVTLAFPSHVRLRFQSLVVARRLLWILSFLYLFRMASFLSTTVPNPVPDCTVALSQDWLSFALLMARMAAGKVSACTDNIYSGHTSLATVFFFANITYSGRPAFVAYSVVHLVALLAAILVTRLHYSVDVLIALFMTSFVYCTYHFLLIVCLDERIFKDQALSKDKLACDGTDVRLLDERRLILCIVNGAILRALLWIDGIDLRTRAPSLPRLRRADCEAGASMCRQEAGRAVGLEGLSPCERTADSAYRMSERTLSRITLL